MGQSLETLAKNIALYRKSWKEAGHLGHGRVTVLLPTFIGQDGAAMKAAVREPMTAHLKNTLLFARPCGTTPPSNAGPRRASRSTAFSTGSPTRR